jgi:uridine kinase
VIDQLLLEIKALPQKSLLLIGIDGPGGVGKTTLAHDLQKTLDNVQIVHMDDFDVPSHQKMMLSAYRPVGPDTEWMRVLHEVVFPLYGNKKAIYKRYDRSSDAYVEEVTIKPYGVVVIEGVFALRRELFSYYDLGVWVDLSLEKRIERVIARDGESSRPLWENDWLPMEEKYIDIYKPHEYADFVLWTN